MSNYDEDFYEWILGQAKALRGGDWPALDMLHLAEEVEDLGKSERRAVISHLRVLLTHLLKWQFQPERRSDSWLHSMGHAQIELQTILHDSPSLRPELSTFVSIAYAQALFLAARETGLSVGAFPSNCPWNPEQLLHPATIPYKGHGGLV
jgi:Domain of unknown function DUF29